MSDYEQDPRLAGSFEHEQMVEYADKALLELAPKYLGDEALMFHSAMRFEVSQEEDDTAEAVPLTRYDNSRKRLAMHIVPPVVIGFAEKIHDDIRQGAEVADLTKVMVGAGVARAIAGWRATKSRLGTEQQRDNFKELLCRKSELWTACDVFDEQHGTKLREAIPRLGDAQIIRINILRFALGASLTHLNDSTHIVARMQESLAESEIHRQTNLDLYMAWLDAKSAFVLYDDTTPELELAFSFPMSPGEELTSFAVS